MSKRARKRARRSQRSRARAWSAVQVEGPVAAKHRRLVRAEVQRERMVRAMCKRQREWDELIECMQPSAVDFDLQRHWEGWRGDIDARDERLAPSVYDDECMYSHVRTTVQPCRLDWWELRECNKRGVEHLPASAYEAKNLMSHVPVR